MLGVCKVCKRAALLTCVTNYQGMGPGHTAVVIDRHVYTFEQVAGSWGNRKSSGWIEIPTGQYLKKNTFRPVVIQELTVKTNASAIFEYISEGHANDDDYLGSGVCSQQAAYALSAGLGRNVDPWGFNTPWNVYQFIRNSGFVSSAYHIPADKAASGYNFRAELILNGQYFPENRRPMQKANILNW